MGIGLTRFAPVLRVLHLIRTVNLQAAMNEPPTSICSSSNQAHKSWQCKHLPVLQSVAPSPHRPAALRTTGRLKPSRGDIGHERKSERRTINCTPKGQKSHAKIRPLLTSSDYTKLEEGRAAFHQIRQELQQFGHCGRYAEPLPAHRLPPTATQIKFSKSRDNG